MKKLTFKKAGETIYYEKIPNGLEVYLFPKSNVTNVYASFGTKYGSIHSEFIPIDKNKMIKVPNGIAHFLEHKLFEQETGEVPFEFYNKNGTYCNAFTSFERTLYLFKGPNNYQENLEYLLDFVQSPYFTDENVEKEKGIIEQEIKMYDDEPLWVMYENILANSFNKDPIGIPIAGTVESIYKITKEDLYTCYNTFYHPSNMFLVVAGNFEVEEALKIIKDNQAKKEFKPFKKIELKKYTEENKVKLEYAVKHMNVEIPLYSYNLKVPLNNFKKMKKKVRNLYLSIIFATLFGSTSKLVETLKEKEYISGDFTEDKIYTDNHLLINLNCKTKFADKVTEEIEKVITNIEITEDDVIAKKNTAMSNFVRNFDDIEEVSGDIVDNIIHYNQLFADVEDIIASLNKTEIEDIISNLDLTNKSIFIINPLNSEKSSN